MPKSGQSTSHPIEPFWNYALRTGSIRPHLGHSSPDCEFLEAAVSGGEAMTATRPFRSSKQQSEGSKSGHTDWASNTREGRHALILGQAMHTLDDGVQLVCIWVDHGSWIDQFQSSPSTKGQTCEPKRRCRPALLAHFPG